MGDRSELNITISFTKEGTTYARLKKISGWGANARVTLLSTGMAQCHPDDKFDPQIGAMIAMARMFGDEVEYRVEEPERKLPDAEKKALENGYTLVRDRLPSCTAHDGKYDVMTGNGHEGDLYWSHKFKTFSSLNHDNDDLSNAVDGEIARSIWMGSPTVDKGVIIAWKPQPDAVEQKALDEGYTLCRDRYPDKSGEYDLITEHNARWNTIPWSSRSKTFGTHDDSCESDVRCGIRAWMTKGLQPAIAWKEHK